MKYSDSNKNETYPFEIISEQASGEDIFKNQVHQRLANTLFDTINSNESGFTIGLEGNYGSGKSTVLRLLRDKIEYEKKDDLKIFYFDAWEHEGDPLKRIFLEELINQCFKEPNSTVRKIQDKINGKVHERDIEIERSTTRLGLSMAIATFLIPLGGSILSLIDKTNLTFENTGDINYWALLGFISIAAPVIVLFLNLLLLTRKAIFKKISWTQVLHSSNWVFLKSDSFEKVTEKSFQDIERTSVEFKQYFNDILQEFQKSKNRKLCIILDNIDRVRPEDSFKLITTLQNYLKDDSGLLESNKLFDKVFTIIPYDVNGITKRVANDEQNDLIYFLDKNLRVRLRLPKITYRDWRNAIDEYFKRKLKDWHEEDIDIACYIFKSINPDTEFSPTPRQINIYLNQLGILRNHFLKDLISTEILCYYIFKTTISLDKDTKESKSQKSNLFSIQQALIDGHLPTEYEEYILNSKTIKEELAAIIFDSLNIEDAFTILLETPIRKSLLKLLPKDTKRLEKTHKDNFWNVLNAILLNSEPTNFFNYIGGVYNFYITSKTDRSLLNLDDKIANFIIKDSVNVLRNISPSSDKVVRSIAALIYFGDLDKGAVLWLNTLEIVLIQGCSNQGSDSEIRKRILLIDETFNQIKDISGFEPKGLMLNTLDFNLGIYAKTQFLENFELADFVEIDREKVPSIMSKSFEEANYLYVVIYLFEREVIEIDKIREVILNNYLKISIEKPVEHIETLLNSNVTNFKFKFSEYIDFLYFISSTTDNIDLRGYLNDSKSPLNYYSIEILDDYIFKIALIRIQVLKDKTRFYRSGNNKNIITFNLFDEPTKEFIEFYIRHLLKFNKGSSFWELSKNADYKFLYRTLLSEVESEGVVLRYDNLNLEDYFIGIMLIRKFKEDRKSIDSEIDDYTNWFIKIGEYAKKEGAKVKQEYEFVRDKYLEYQFTEEVILELSDQFNFFRKVLNKDEL